jgi:hypothetical protein
MAVNKRYAELNNKIENWFNKGEQDINILRSLYAQSNLEANPMVDRTDDIKGGTMFSKLTDKELLAKFEKEHFNNYNDKELRHLFQEAHNRFIKESGLDVTRNVVVKVNAQEPGMGGYVCFADDILFMNKYLINQGKATKDKNKIINENSIGKVYLDVLLHETKHNIQYEDAIDFALGNKQEQDRAFAGALMIINNSNFYIADEKKDRGYTYEWRSKYDWHAYEHEANYAAIERIEKFYDPEKKKTLDYAQFTTLYMDASLHFRPDPHNPEKNEAACKDRVNKIEDYVLKQLKYFEEGTKDCPLKESVIKTMKEYTAVDENGHSPLRDRFNKEVRQLCDYSVKAQRKIEEFAQKSGKKTGKLMPEFNDEPFNLIM